MGRSTPSAVEQRNQHREGSLAGHLLPSGAAITRIWALMDSWRGRGFWTGERVGAQQWAAEDTSGGGHCPLSVNP